jgi:hypothetical protein
MTDTESNKEIETHQTLDYERYVAAREAANSSAADQFKFIDQTILAFGGGGLGITLTFMHDFVTIPIEPCLLYIGDGLLLFSVLVVLISLYTSQKSISDHVDQLDEAARNDFGRKYTEFMKTPYVNSSAKHTAFLNKVAMGSVIIGMVLVALFVFQNLSQKEPPKMIKNLDTKMNHSGGDDVQKALVIPPPAIAPKPSPTQEAPQPKPK